MNALTGLTAYLLLNFFITIGLIGSLLFSLCTNKLGFATRARSELRLNYWLLIGCLAFTIASLTLPTLRFSESPIEISIASVDASRSIKNENPGPIELVNVSAPGLSTSLQAAPLQQAILLLSMTLLAGILMILSLNISQLLFLKMKSCEIRRIGQIRILASEKVSIPFAVWHPQQALIFLPYQLIGQTRHLRKIVAHEIQHHRQRDTQWAYMLLLLKMFCFWNPFLHLWKSRISELQEFSCDEALVEEKNYPQEDYAQCLLEVALSTINYRERTVCAAGLSLIHKNLLKRRIEKMMTRRELRKTRFLAPLVGLFMASLMGAMAFASKQAVQDRRISLKQAEELAKNAMSDSDFAILMNDRILKQLNRYVGTREGRDSMRLGLKRMKVHQQQIETKMKEYKVPSEILAVPLIESGYRNLPESQNSAWPTWNAAGLWQFIRSTARIYGLVVTPERDERLDVHLLTDAAMRYLKSNYLRFKDWHLAALAYNMGEEKVQKGIESLGSKDAWVLIESGFEGDKNYLPKLMAAIIIMRNPELIL